LWQQSLSAVVAHTQNDDNDDDHLLSTITIVNCNTTKDASNQRSPLTSHHISKRAIATNKIALS
jgi:hypothetical protein